LSGRGLCDELITRPEESYRLWCVVVCDLETSRIGAPYKYDISNLRVKVKNSHIVIALTITYEYKYRNVNIFTRHKLRLFVTQCKDWIIYLHNE